ncbi:MAG: hypothetical protein UT02_C0014G0014 [Parcubacteria group bacterium GW2011_GWC2_38_7]|nr:MAG: hypothetical protein UT02_C0014G0014 [Parcubacteria group bacterium GW2011_GWC2_38_7]
MNESSDLGMGLLGFFLFVFWVAYYVYSALCWYYMAKRTKTTHKWFAFVPVLDNILMLKIAKQPLWWVILLFIPMVNIVVAVLVYLELLQVLKRPTWWIIMMFVPIANLVFLGLMAWGKNNNE